MKINITGKGIELTDAISAYVEKKFSGLDKFNDKIIRANVVVGMDTKHHVKGQVFICECKLEIPGKDVFAEKNEKVLYKAIDKVRDYLEGELKKHKGKTERTDKRGKTIGRAVKEYQI